MKKAKDIHRLLENVDLSINADADKEVLETVLRAGRKSTASVSQGNVWRIIMRSKMTKFATAGIIFATLIGVSLFKGTPVWAIEQTVQALKNIQTVTITGTTVYHDANNTPEYKPFKCWVKLSDNNDNLLMRFESPREVVVVQGDKVYFHRPGSKKVKIYEGQMIHNIELWYKVMELSPWLSGKILKTLKPLADDWQEEYGNHAKTNRECVFVNCRYEQLSASFWFAFDVESKLIVEARQWSNPNHKEPVNFYADSFVYNEDFPNETFQFEMPEGAKVVYQKDIDRKEELLRSGMALFEDGQYAEALNVFQKADIPYMVGICYDNMGEHEKAIESFRDEITREDDFQGSLSSTYFYLGNSYMNVGQKDKAIQAFENCLQSGRGFRDTEVFPMKDARNCIEKLKSQN
ncbi:MAG: tetratricopeptide repeat protein [Planctomycetota bacterium]|jgi:hypothetical protein